MSLTGFRPVPPLEYHPRPFPSNPGRSDSAHIWPLPLPSNQSNLCLYVVVLHNLNPPPTHCKVYKNVPGYWGVVGKSSHKFPVSSSCLENGGYLDGGLDDSARYESV